MTKLIDIEHVKEQKAAATVPAGSWPPGYGCQIVTDAETGRTVYAWQKNRDLDPFLHPEQIGRMPPVERAHDTREACLVAARADYEACGGWHLFVIQENDHVSATTEGDAWKIWERATGLDRVEDADNEIRVIADDYEFKVWCDEDGEPIEHGDGNLVTKTSAEWAATFPGEIVFSHEV